MPTTNNTEEAPANTTSNVALSQEHKVACKYYLDDSLPVPKGNTAKLFAVESKETQIKQANKIAKSLQGKNDNHADPDLLNINTSKISFLIAVPDSIRKTHLV